MNSLKIDQIRISAYILISFLFSYVYSYSGGPPTNYANNAPNFRNCTSCHSGTVNSGDGGVLITGLPDSGYVPGESYQITVTVSGTNLRGYGFQMASQTGNNSTGTFSLNNNSTDLELNGDFIQQSSRTISGEWIMQWLAPSQDVGDITFSASGMATGGNSSTSGDNVYTSSYTVSAYQGPVVLLGDVTQNNDVSMMDAAEILRYLVGDVDLNNYQQVAADVTLDQSISALDASVIAQYATGLIDTFSSLGNLNGTGELSVSNNLEYLPGEILEIPIILNSSDNFLSFEFEVSYDAEQLIYNDIEWSQLSTSFMLEQKFESGSIRLVGSSTTPVDVLGILAIIKMQVSQSVDEDYIDLVIEKMRINELEPVFDVIVSVAQEVLSNDIVSVPSQYELYQNFPNPFNPTTEIRYALAELSDVVVSVYDLKGRLMKTLISQKQPAGLNKILWDGTDNVGKKVSAGMYLYTIEAGTFRKTKKMVMLN